MTIQEDEVLKAAVHGIVLGAILPVLTYNLKVKNSLNIFIYSALSIFELYNILGHLKDSQSHVASK